MTNRLNGFATQDDYAKAKQEQADAAEFRKSFNDYETGRLRDYQADAIGTVTGRYASSNPEIHYNVPKRSKHIGMLAAASAAGFIAQSLSAQRMAAEITAQAEAMGATVIGDEIHFSGAADYSDIEARMQSAMQYIDYYAGVPVMSDDLRALNNNRIPVDEPSSVWTTYPGEPTPAGGSKRYYANIGGKAKALDKRRAKNKAARKARRK